MVGGSLGSKTINESMFQNLNLFKKHNLNLIWQTGISFKEESNKFIDNLKVKGISSHVFIKRNGFSFMVSRYYCF